MELQTEGIHIVSGTHQEIAFNVRVHQGMVNVRHQADLRKLLDAGLYEIALDHPAHGGIRYDEHGWEVAPVPQVTISVDRVDSPTKTPEKPAEKPAAAKRR